MKKSILAHFMLYMQTACLLLVNGVFAHCKRHGWRLQMAWLEAANGMFGGCKQQRYDVETAEIRCRERVWKDNRKRQQNVTASQL